MKRDQIKVSTRTISNQTTALYLEVTHARPPFLFADFMQSKALTRRVYLGLSQSRQREIEQCKDASCQSKVNSSFKDGLV